MTAWYLQSYFLPSTPCKREGEAGAFRPLSEVFPPAFRNHQTAPPRAQSQELTAPPAAAQQLTTTRAETGPQGKTASQGVATQPSKEAVQVEETTAEGAEAPSETAPAVSEEDAEDEEWDIPDEEEGDGPGTPPRDPAAPPSLSSASEEPPAVPSSKSSDASRSDAVSVSASVFSLSSASNARSTVSPVTSPSASTSPSALSSPSASSSPSQHTWIYVDDVGKLQGPYPTEHMRAWYLSGYFKPHTAVRRDDEPTLRQLQFHTNTDFIPTPTPPPPPPMPPPPVALHPPPPPPRVLYTPDPTECDFFYTDNAGMERGPFSTSQMRHWHQQGFFTYNQCPVRAAHQLPAAALPLHLHPVPPAFILSAEAAARAGRLQERWMYVDFSGSTQGPFTTAEMAAWYSAGFIAGPVRVQQAGEEGGDPREVWRTVEQRGEQCSFVRMARAKREQQTAPHAQPSAGEGEGRAGGAYSQRVLVGPGKAVSAERAQPVARKDISDHYYDQQQWQDAQQHKRQRV